MGFTYHRLFKGDFLSKEHQKNKGVGMEKRILTRSKWTMKEPDIDT